jgi:predicted ATPase
MLVTHRPEWQAEWAGTYGHVMPLSVGRLAKPQIAELVESMVGGRADETLIAEVTTRTDGVPLFVEELTRSLIERGARTGALENPRHPSWLADGAARPAAATGQGDRPGGLGDRTRA